MSVQTRACIFLVNESRKYDSIRMIRGIWNIASKLSQVSFWYLTVLAVKIILPLVSILHYTHGELNNVLLVLHKTRQQHIRCQGSKTACSKLTFALFMVFLLIFMFIFAFRICKKKKGWTGAILNQTNKRYFKVRNRHIWPLMPEPTR